MTHTLCALVGLSDVIEHIASKRGVPWSGEPPTRTEAEYAAWMREARLAAGGAAAETEEGHESEDEDDAAEAEAEARVNATRDTAVITVDMDDDDDDGDAGDGS